MARTLQPIGTELIVSDLRSASDPSIAALADGGFAIVWGTQSLYNEIWDTNVFARVFDAGATASGTEFRINSTIEKAQIGPDITGRADGGFVIAWMDERARVDSTFQSGLMAQYFDVQGTKSGGEWQLNTSMTPAQSEPALATLSGGRFVAVWSDSSADSRNTDIHAQLFDKQGAKLGSEFLVNSITGGSQYEPRVAALSGGGFVVSWTDDGHALGDDNAAIAAQVFSVSGARRGNEIRVNTNTAGIQWHPSVAGLADGGFVVTWEDWFWEGKISDFNVEAQIYDATGARRGGEFTVSTVQRGDQRFPAVTALSDGGFMVAWQDDASGTIPDSFWGIAAQAFDASGARFGSPFQVNTITSTHQGHPSITTLVDGRIVVAWESWNAISAQVFAFVTMIRADDDSATMKDTDPTASFAVLSNDEAGAVLNAVSSVTVTAPDTRIGPEDAALAIVDGRIQLTLGSDFGLLIEGQGAVIDVSYTVTDGAAASDTATLSVEVIGSGSGVNLTGTEGNDQLAGSAGNDVLAGLGGNDDISGLEGNDVFDGGTGLDLLTGDEGNDTLRGGSDADKLDGNGGNDVLAGGAGDDRLLGGAGKDVLSGDEGDDTLAGGAGSDTYIVGLGDRVIEFAGGGTDTVQSAANWTLAANIERLVLTGSRSVAGVGNAAANTITGNAASNSLSGLGGADTLLGGAGEDVLRGGSGNDKLTGGADADVFVFDAALSAAANRDTITDFVSGVDALHLDDDVFTALAIGSLSDAQFRAGAGIVTAQDADDRIIYNTTTGALYYDADGTGTANTAVAFAVLSNLAAITAADFAIVA